MPTQLAVPIVACWADPVVVGGATVLDVTGFAVVRVAPTDGSALLATIGLRQRDSGEDAVLPGEPVSAVPPEAQDRLPVERVVGVRAVSALGAGGLRLGEGVWDAYVEVSGAAWPAVRRRLAAERLDAAEGDYSAMRVLGDPRYRPFINARGRLSIDVRADDRHVEVTEVWVRPSHVEVLGAVHGWPDGRRGLGAATAIARRRGDGAELALGFVHRGADSIVVKVPLNELAGLDSHQAVAHTWDLRLVVGEPQHELRFAGLLDDILSKRTVVQFPSSRAGSRLLRPRFGARNDLVVLSTRASA